MAAVGTIVLVVLVVVVIVAICVVAVIGFCYFKSRAGKKKSCLPSVDFTEYRCSAAVERLVRRRHGDNILVLGSTLGEIRTFWNHVGYKADKDITDPREVSKTVVDIDCKSHGNYATEDPDGVEGEDKKAKDWYDEFNITSKKSRDDTKSKSYNIQTAHSDGFQIGGSAGLEATSAFFNLAGGGVKPSLGINASYHQDKSETISKGGSKEVKLSQAYQIVDNLCVPPKKKVEAKIITWAVTYEAKTTLRYTVDADIVLPVRYRNHISRVLGGLYMSMAYIPAREIFADEDNSTVNDNNVVTFTREANVSYIGERVEIQKSKTDLE